MFSAKPIYYEMLGAVLQDKIPKGLLPDAARDPSQRIEHVLDVVERVRHSLHPASRLHPANAALPGPDKVFTDDDMKMALKTWENNPKDWMDETTLRALDCDQELTSAKKHKMRHSAFSTMQFQLLGKKHLIHYLIKYPVLRTPSKPFLISGQIIARAKNICVQWMIRHRARKTTPG